MKVRCLLDINFILKDLIFSTIIYKYNNTDDFMSFVNRIYLLIDFVVVYVYH